MSFSDGSVGFSDGSVAFSTGSTAFPSGTIAQPERSGRELRFQLMADLLFDFDRAELRPEAEGVLRDLVAQIHAKTKRPMLRIEGHTDAKGSEPYNQDLSVRRAASVKSWLVRSAELPAKSIATAGFGETQPVAPNEKLRTARTIRRVDRRTGGSRSWSPAALEGHRASAEMPA